MKLVFGDIVVVDGDQIGVVVKCWGASLVGSKRFAHVEVYVRSYGAIQEYRVDKIERYQVRHEDLSEEELGYQREAETME